MTRTEQVAQQQIARLNADPDVQQLCTVWLNQVGHDPRVQQLCAGARTPFEAYVRVMLVADPATLQGEITDIVGLQDQDYGPVPAARDADPVAPAQAQRPAGIDWGREFPDSKVLAAWRALPAHSRLRETARSPQFEALARRSFAKAGVVPFPGTTEGETFAMLLNYAGKTKALASGDRAAYDSLARHLRGVLGDGETIRTQVEQVRQIAYDDWAVNHVTESLRAQEAEAAKHRARPVENPVYDKKHLPQHAPLKAKEKPRDTTRDEVARQFARQKAGGELPERAPMRPLNKTIHNKLEMDVALALIKHKGEPPSRVFAKLSPEMRRHVVNDLRDRGIEPALASSRATSGTERHWVPAASNPSSGNTSSGGYSGGTSPGGGSGEAASEAPASTGTGQ